MEFEISKSIGGVRLAILDTAARSENRRLQYYSNAVPCKSGCAGCCSRLQEISVAEAVIIYEYLHERGQWPDVRLVALGQFPLASQTSPLSWFKMNLKCPVLDQSMNCRAYPVRPAVCSTHFVTSDPKACDPWAVAPGSYKSLDFSDLLEKYRECESSSLDGHGVLNMKLPLPIALLLAERINMQSGLSLDQAVELIYREL